MKTENKSNWCPSSSRWCIYIDVLGFSKLWEPDPYKANPYKAIRPLNRLMRDIFRIGTRCYPEAPERLFVHQAGDGFAIVSDFGEASLERPIGIAIALMRSVASVGAFASASIAEGDHMDITGMYPQEVIQQYDDGTVRMGSGLMTLSSVMGSAFIRAYGLGGRAPSGPLLSVDLKSRAKIPGCFPNVKTSDRRNGEIIAIDWVRSQSPLVSHIQSQADLETPNANQIVCWIENYFILYPCLREKWKTGLGAFGIAE